MINQTKREIYPSLQGFYERHCFFVRQIDDALTPFKDQIDTWWLEPADFPSSNSNLKTSIERAMEKTIVNLRLKTGVKRIIILPSLYCDDPKEIVSDDFYKFTSELEEIFPKNS